MEDTTENRLFLAVLLACPACVGGFLLPFGVAMGFTVGGLRAAVGLLVLGVIVYAWARNAWNRRNEGCLPSPLDSQVVPAPIRSPVRSVSA